MGSKGQNSTLSEHGYVAYQIKENQECSNMVANILPSPGDGSIGRNLTFPEHGHVAYQIKDNQECSNIVANILPAVPPEDGVNRSKFNFFRTLSCCISNYRESRMQQHGSKYFARRTRPHCPDPGDGVNRSKFNLFRTWSCCISN